MMKKYTEKDIGCYANGLLFGRTHVRDILFSLMKETLSCTSVKRDKKRQKYLKDISKTLLKDPVKPFPDGIEFIAAAACTTELCDISVAFYFNEDQELNLEVRK